MMATAVSAMESTTSLQVSIAQSFGLKRHLQTLVQA